MSEEQKKIERAAKAKAKRDANKQLFTALNDIDRLESLLKNGANPDTKNSEGKTPLHVACELNVNEIDKILYTLYKYDGTVSLTDCYGDTPLHYAVRANNYEAVHRLIDCDNNALNIKNDANRTPLSYAVSYNPPDAAAKEENLKIIKLLLNYRATVTDEIIASIFISPSPTLNVCPLVREVLMKMIRNPNEIFVVNEDEQ